MVIISKQVSNILKYNEIFKFKSHAIIIEPFPNFPLLKYKENKGHVYYVGLHFQGLSAVQL